MLWNWGRNAPTCVCMWLQGNVISFKSQCHMPSILPSLAFTFPSCFHLLVFPSPYHLSFTFPSFLHLHTHLHASLSSLLNIIQDWQVSPPAHESPCIWMHPILWWACTNFRCCMMQQTQDSLMIKIKVHRLQRWWRYGNGWLWSTCDSQRQPTWSEQCSIQLGGRGSPSPWVLHGGLPWSSADL